MPLIPSDDARAAVEAVADEFYAEAWRAMRRALDVARRIERDGEVILPAEAIRQAVREAAGSWKA